MEVGVGELVGLLGGAVEATGVCEGETVAVAVADTVGVGESVVPVGMLDGGGVVVNVGLRVKVGVTVGSADG